jgi:hypothetical protein
MTQVCQDDSYHRILKATSHEMYDFLRPGNGG